MNSVTKQLTGNPHLPFEVLRVFTDIKILWAINHTTPTCVLEELSTHKAPTVRASVARNPNTPQGVLEKLSKDLAWDVRYCAHHRLYASV